MLADWFLIALVVLLAIVLFVVMTKFLDQLISYWRAYRDDHSQT